MTAEPGRSSVEIAGYALGVGLAFVPLLGIPVRFLLADAPALAIYAGAFAVGLLLGALLPRLSGRG